MLNQLPLNNFSFTLVLLYFGFYTTSLFLFFVCLLPFLSASNNLNYLVRLCRYDRFLYNSFVFSVFSLIGIPPFCLFAPKFSGLTFIWAHSNYFFFFFSLLVTILSFTIYLQIFDLLFSHKEYPNDNHAIDEFKKLIRVIAAPLNIYSRTTFIVFMIVFNIIGLFWFKDFFFILCIFS